MTEPTDSRITRLLGDRYELIELLGKGGFAGVYRVRNLRLQRTEALKVLSESMTEDADFAKRFEQEARVAAALDHPNIVKIYDYGAIEDFFWFSMQFIDGPSVGRELKTREFFEDAAGARIAVGVLDALAYSHARGVIHRDIKPDNILLDREVRPYLTDFGVAKSQLALVKTHAGTLLGSPAYMSPEQLQGKLLDGRSDIYALGVTLYKMLSGALPFSGEDTLRATMKRLREDPEPLLSRRRGIHPLLAEIVMRALERDPAKRFPDAAAMREELESFVTDVTPPRTRISALTGATARSEDVTPTQVMTPAGPQPPPPATPPAPTVPAPAAPPPSAAPAPRGTKPPGPPAASLPPAAKPSEPRRGRGTVRAGWIALAAAVAALVAALVLIRRSAPEQQAPPPPVTVVASPPAVPAPAAAASPEPSPMLTEAPTETPTVQAPEPTSKARLARAAASPTHTPRRATMPPTRIPTVRPTPAPTAASSSAPSSGKRPVQILEQAPLVLPSDVSAAHRGESIGLLVIVGADGKLKTARVISPVCAECDRAALDAVRHFRFRAATDAKGDPIEGTFGFALRIP